jgi:rubrerythrin
MKLKDPNNKNSHNSNELMLDPNVIVYRCNICHTTFHGLPENECLYCSETYDMRTKQERLGLPLPISKTSERDYLLW